MKRLAPLALFLLLASPVSAGKITGSITGINSDGVINHDDTVSFTVTTNAARWGTALACSQDGVAVLYGGTVFHDGPVTDATSDSYTLSSGAYQGGAATCTVTLISPKGTPTPRYRTLDTLDFEVSP